MDKLLPCPFCGHSPVLDGKSDYVSVRCEDCGASGRPRYFDSDEEIAHAEGSAIAAWNRRAALSSPADKEKNN